MLALAVAAEGAPLPAWPVAFRRGRHSTERPCCGRARLLAWPLLSWESSKPACLLLAAGAAAAAVVDIARPSLHGFSDRSFSGGWLRYFNYQRASIKMVLCCVGKQSVKY